MCDMEFKSYLGSLISYLGGKEYNASSIEKSIKTTITHFISEGQNIYASLSLLNLVTLSFCCSGKPFSSPKSVLIS
jgi:hypothetical protein